MFSSVHQLFTAFLCFQPKIFLLFKKEKNCYLAYPLCMCVTIVYLYLGMKSEPVPGARTE